MSSTQIDSDQSLVDVTIEREMQRSYLDYAMSVIVSRALPDCRDGLKPVHRRILYAMHDTGNYHGKPYRKSARVVGEVMGKYHPHGDDPIYGALVRMAQDFSLRMPLVDGQGNFGSIDGDSPAQMRYTEVRLEKLSDYAMLLDLDKDTVDFQNNYDGSEKEPSVLPARFPNILVNGASGIAVGMATNIPTHNMGEVIDACCAYLDNNAITTEEIADYVPGPDFPSGGEILGKRNSAAVLAAGRGSIVVRGKAAVEAYGGRGSQIVISELPYQVNKAELVKTIERLAREKIIEDITEVRDESNKLGIRVVLNVKNNAEPEVVLNQLYKMTQLQTSFAVNMLALRKGTPSVMNVLDFISEFVQFREEVVTRRTLFLLAESRKKVHLLIGLLVAINNLDEVILLIKKSKDAKEAKDKLLSKKWDIKDIKPILTSISDDGGWYDDNLLQLTEFQVKAILDMKLHKLTGLEYQKLSDDINELVSKIRSYVKILNSRDALVEVIKEELLSIKERFATPRLTSITDGQLDIQDEDLIQSEDMVVIVTKGGYIKRTSLSSYKGQRRGGKGKVSMATHDDDIVVNALVTNTHDSILFFSDKGIVYRLKVYQLPLGSLQSKGRAIVNLISIGQDESISNILTLGAELLKDSEKLDQYLIFATTSGKVRRNALSDFSNIKSSGKIAMKLSGDDRLVGVVLCKSEDHVLLATKQGKAVRFAVDNLRIFKGRLSDGIRGVKLSLESDLLVSISILNGVYFDGNVKDALLHIDVKKRIKLVDCIRVGDNQAMNKLILSMRRDITTGGIDSDVAKIISDDQIKDFCLNEQFILTINNYGYGKRTSAYEYRTTNRGGSGILNMNLSKANQSVVSSFPVEYADEIMVLTDSGKMIRTSIGDVRITSRSAIGVKIIDIKGKEQQVISVSRIDITSV